MSLYCISDPHLSLSCDKPMDVFGGLWQDYVKKLEENWKKVITNDDTVVIPGDISWGMNLKECFADFSFIDSLQEIFLLHFPHFLRHSRLSGLLFYLCI